MPDRPSRAPRRRAKPPRLLGRFALYAGIALVVAAVAAFFFVRHYSISRAERNAVSQSDFIADSLLPQRLRAADFAGPAEGPRLRQMDRLFNGVLRSDGALRVKLYDTDGRVVYSTDHSLIGTRPPGEDVLDASKGQSSGSPTNLNAEGGSGPNTKALETYVPVRLHGDIVGVFERYADYGPIASDAQSIFVPLAIGIAVVLLGLYLALLPILRRTTRTLRLQLEEIEHKAYHDDLTGLPNRALFNERVAAALDEAARKETQLAVLLVDLDRFKEVNDTLGHASGDRLLCSLAADLPAQMRRADTVSRLGGDEFGVLAVEISDPSAVLALAEKLRSILARSRQVDGIEVEIDASIGVALYPSHGTQAETLLRRADVAMYRSKELGSPVLYESDHDEYSAARLSLVAELHRAIGAGELVVDYQPQHDPASRELRGVEALLRWQHPTRGLLMPNEFIPLAEHTGLIRELTRHVVDVALRQCREWRNDGLDLPVAVNISPRDLLDSDFPRAVAAGLRRYGIEPGRLELEITENAAITDLPRARAILADLHALGVSLAIDDFGTGNSSLAYFRSLPIDVVKIDRSFVMEMAESADDAAIVQSTIVLAHDLGLRVVAEGVESEACNNRLADLGCDLVQGFLFGRATGPDEVSAALGRSAS